MRLMDGLDYLFESGVPIPVLDALLLPVVDIRGVHNCRNGGSLPRVHLQTAINDLN